MAISQNLGNPHIGRITRRGSGWALATSLLGLLWCGKDRAEPWGLGFGCL